MRRGCEHTTHALLPCRDIAVLNMASSSGKELALLHDQVELGVYDRAILAKLVDSLILEPHILLPQLLQPVRHIAFHLEKANAHPVALVVEYWILRWQLEHGDEEGATIPVADIAYIASDEEDLTDPALGSGPINRIPLGPRL